jgi:redox-sensing transcriptional repressor
MSESESPSRLSLEPALPSSKRRADLPEETASEVSTTRMSLYLRALARCEAEGITVVSSTGLAAAAGCKPALVRKDLAHFGQFGVRGVGYEVGMLRTRIRRIFGLDEDLPVVIVGAGNLGTALAGYRGFNTRGFRTIALFDVDPAKITRRSPGGIPVRAMRDLPRVAKKERIDLAILAVPAEAAQKTLDQIAAAGIRAVLNFAPVRLKARRGVHVRSVDLRVHLEGLAYLVAHSGSRASRR